MDQKLIDRANREILAFTVGFPHFDSATRQAVSTQRVAEELIKIRLLLSRVNVRISGDLPTRVCDRSNTGRPSGAANRILRQVSNTRRSI